MNLKTFKTLSGQVGRFFVSDLEKLDDRYVVGDCAYMFDVLGEHTIEDWQEPPIDIAPIKWKVIQSIDIDVDKIYADVIGNRGTEYAEAEREALDFKAADYLGQVPSTVQSWATVKNWLPPMAADDIIAQAGAWRTAALSIRANRLKEKEAVRVALSLDEINAAQTRWNAFRSGIRTALGIGA